MGGYFCEQCNGGKDSHEHGHHYGSTEGNPVYYVWCEDCHGDVMADVANGDRAFAAIDGEIMEGHFVCAECLEVRPLTRLVEHLDEGRPCFACQFCQPNGIPAD